MIPTLEETIRLTRETVHGFALAMEQIASIPKPVYESSGRMRVVDYSDWILGAGAVRLEVDSAH